MKLERCGEIRCYYLFGGDQVLLFISREGGVLVINVQ